MTGLLVALVTARLTLLVTHDDLTEPWRRALSAWVVNGGRLRVWLVDLLTCPWCLSVWIGAVVATLAWYHPTHALLHIAGWCAAGSLGAGIVARWH